MLDAANRCSLLASNRTNAIYGRIVCGRSLGGFETGAFVFMARPIGITGRAGGVVYGDGGGSLLRLCV